MEKVFTQEDIESLLGAFFSGKGKEEFLKSKEDNKEARKMEKAVGVESERLTHFYIADNSDALRGWLDSKGIEYIRNGHFTCVGLEHDIFRLGMEFGVYKHIEQNKRVVKV